MHGEFTFRDRADGRGPFRGKENRGHGGRICSIATTSLGVDSPAVPHALTAIRVIASRNVDSMRPPGSASKVHRRYARVVGESAQSGPAGQDDDTGSVAAVARVSSYSKMMCLTPGRTGCRRNDDMCVCESPTGSSAPTVVIDAKAALVRGPL